MIGSAAGIVALTNLGTKSVDQAYQDQLSSNAIGFTRMTGQEYASIHWGGAPQTLVWQYWGTNWKDSFFDWTRMGYTITDSEGNVLQEQPIPDDRYNAAYTFDNAIIGTYMKVVNTYPYEEPQAPTEPVRMDSEVLVMPTQEMTPIGAVYIRYTDGHQTEWAPDIVWGTLWYHGGNTLTFESNEIGSIPSGDGWYPSYIRLEDMGGNVVYEAEKDGCIFIGEEQDGTFYKIHLPAAAITTAAPAGVTFESGDYRAYDAIPTQGVTVASMHFTYATPQGEIMGSEGISSPGLIGTLFHDHNGNAEFHSNEPMTTDIPEGSLIVDITFADAQQNCLFEASCPDGVGILSNDENGCLVFRGQMPGTVIAEEIPLETEPEEMAATISPEEPEYLTGFAREPLNIHKAPSREAEVVGMVEAWQEIEIVKQESFDGQLWCLIPGGWILMDQVLLSETTPAAFSLPRTITADLPDTAPAEDIPAETVVPEATESTEAPEETMEPMAEAAEASIPTEPADYYDPTGVESGVYYDSGLQQQMVAEYIWEPIPDGYTITVSLAPGALGSDELGWTLLRLAEAFEHLLLELLGICIAVFALCVVHLSCSAGRTRRNNEVRAGGLNRIPLDLYLLGGGLGVTGLVAAAIYGSEYFAQNDQQLAILFCGACAYFASLLLVAFFFACLAQFKTPGGYWWRNTLCGRCLRLLIHCGRDLDRLGRKCVKTGVPLSRRFFRWLRRLFVGLWDTARRLLRWVWNLFGKCIHWFSGHLARFFSMLPITWQFLTTGFTLVFLLYVMMRTYKVGYILLGFGIFFAVILYAASAFAILLESAKRMSRGDLDTRVDDRMLIGGFREFAERLNDLAGVAVIAAQKQLKSERMKTELITNVSHDIKTPLTSIINYVDLLQKPHTPEQQEQYLEVLDRQSQRLKKLIDDLMEMSKASTGNIAVDIETVDAGEAVNQALGEFADKLEKVQLTPVFRQPDDPVYMLADGKLVWRVMSNLLGNAVKYALPGTRIYLDLMEMDGKVILSMKNISREELNVHADELMERFVRGDASRNTEGSGLGLNITQSLMELQKGQLQILVDGDLFKVTLIFPAA